MYRIKTSLQKAPLHDHMSFFFKKNHLNVF